LENLSFIVIGAAIAKGDAEELMRGGYLRQKGEQDNCTFANGLQRIREDMEIEAERGHPIPQADGRTMPIYVFLSSSGAPPTTAILVAMAMTIVARVDKESAPRLLRV
jgi:hypothetical protein